MARIRVVGRQNTNARCAICHGALGRRPSECSACGVGTHADCVAAHGRCPTLGCAGTASAAGAPLVRAASAHRPPASSARFGPYARLVSSAVITSLITLLLAAYLTWPLFSWHSFWDFATRTKRGGHDESSGAVTMLITFPMALVGIAFAVRWLLRIPAVFREVRHLLDDTVPVPMTISTYARRQGKKTVWYAKLEGAGQPMLDLEIGGLLPAGWLRSMPPRTQVLVYGLPPPGPYLIELPDGRLALVHPD